VQGPKKPCVIILLSILTFGIYWLYWYYSVNKYLFEHSEGKLKFSPCIALLSQFVPIANFVSLFNTAKRIQTINNICKDQYPIDPSAAVLFSIFLPSGIYTDMIQSAINAHWHHHGYATIGQYTTYADKIRNTFNLVHKNWQLVLVQLATMIISHIGFFVFIGIPLAVAFVIFGLDLTELTRLKDIIGTMREPSEIISRYFGIFIVLLVSFVVYLLVITTVGIYVLGGSAGLIGRGIKDDSFRFKLNTFFSEAKRLFFPLVGFTTIIGIIFIGVAFILGLFSRGIAAIISIAKAQEATLALFIDIFFSLLLFCAWLVFIICTSAITLYGVAAIVFKNIGGPKSFKDAMSVWCQYRVVFIIVHLLPALAFIFILLSLLFPYYNVILMAILVAILVFLLCLVFVFHIFLLIKMGAAKPLKDAVRYLYNRPDALLLCIIIVIGWFLISPLFLILGAPLLFISVVIPIGGTITYQIFSYTVQSYLGLVIVAVIFIYYFSTEVKPSETPDEGTEPVSGNSISLSDTSQNQAPEQEPPLPEKEGLR
jgi:hypothetical protein